MCVIAYGFDQLSDMQKVSFFVGVLIGDALQTELRLVDLVLLQNRRHGERGFGDLWGFRESGTPMVKSWFITNC